MLRIKLLTAMLSVIIAMADEFSLFKSKTAKPEIEEKKFDWPPKEEKESKGVLKIDETITVSASIYHPEPSQTDSTPFITADGSRINKRNPKKHRWIAVSRDLHTKWGGEISFGDSLWVTGISDDLDGLYIVRDVMNKRIRKQIDILVGKNDRIMGFWKNVYIAKLD